MGKKFIFVVVVLLESIELNCKDVGQREVSDNKVQSLLQISIYQYLYKAF